MRQMVSRLQEQERQITSYATIFSEHKMKFDLHQTEIQKILTTNQNAAEF
jgi:hypothetical protein